MCSSLSACAIDLALCSLNIDTSSYASLKKKKLENARKIYTQPPQITKQTEQVQNTGHLLRIHIIYISGDIIGR